MENIILNAAGISKTYHAGSVDVEALKKSDVLFKKGEFTAIVGKSGSGKSTLLRIIGTMDRPDEGTVEIEGMNVFEMKDKQLSKFRREKIGFIYQDYSLFPEFTAYENIVVPFALDNKNASEEEIDGILESLGISHCKGKYPSQMSGGEQQRVSIARAIVNRPPLLVCDEPTGNLDPQNSRGIMDLLERINRTGTTVLVATHDREMVDNMRRRVIALDRGVLTRDQDRGVYGFDA